MHATVLRFGLDLAVSRHWGEHARAETLLRALHSELPSNSDTTNYFAFSLTAQNDQAKVGEALQYAELNLQPQPDLRTEAGRTAAATLGCVLFRTGNHAASR